MSDTPPPADAGRPAGRGPLTPEAIDAVLADFRRWLEGLADAPPPPPEPPGPAVDLATLVGAFTALRHEVNLLTKATRAQAEQFGKALDLSTSAQNESPGNNRSDRRLVETLIDTHDTIERSVRDLDQQRGQLEQYRNRERFLELHPELSREARVDRFVGSLFPRRTFWQWLRGARPSETEALMYQVVQLESKLEKENMDRVLTRDKLTTTYQRLDASVLGLRMSQRRIERAMIENGIEPINAIEQPFDPDAMEVIDTVTESGKPSGTVVEEVRRGYCWRGRVFRYAQVRVAK